MGLKTRVERLEQRVQQGRENAPPTEAEIEEALLAGEPRLRAWIQGEGPALTRDEINEAQLKLLRIPYSRKWFEPGDEVRARAQAQIFLTVILARAKGKGLLPPEPPDDDWLWLWDYATEHDHISWCLLHNITLGLICCEAWARGEDAVFGGEVVGNAFGIRGVMPEDDQTGQEGKSWSGGANDPADAEGVAVGVTPVVHVG